VALEFGVIREMQDEWPSGARNDMLWPMGKVNLPGDDPRRNSQETWRSHCHQQRRIPRRTTLEALAKLKPIYGSPTVTPGNAPPMSAGAGAILFMTRKKAEEKGLKPLATIVAATCASTAPRYIASIPAITIQKSLNDAGLTVDDMNLIEINEAFAAMPVVSTKILAEGNEKSGRPSWTEQMSTEGPLLSVIPSAPAPPDHHDPGL